MLSLFLQKIEHFHLGIYSFQSVVQVLDFHRCCIMLKKLASLALLVHLVVVAVIGLRFLVVLTSTTFAEEPIL